MSSNGKPKRVALVPNRFGPNVPGGAEAVLTEMGRGLLQRGWEVDVITSAARDHVTWRNEFPVGESVEQGMHVHRFPTVVEPRRSRPDDIGRRILMGQPTSIDEQYRWINGTVRVPGMFEYLLDHGDGYRALFLAPYMFWTTFACSEAWPQRTVLMPCLHDEPFAYLDIYKPMFSSVHGVCFLSEPERDLAERIHDLPARQSVIGSGVDVRSGYDPEGFRRRRGIDGDFVFYAGRREWGKGFDELLTLVGFANRVLSRPVRIVTCGVGEIGRVPDNVEVVDLGWISDDERSDAMAAATVYVNPSVMESFSRTIMEAWLAQTPVLANARSAVLRWHCERSQGGFAYQDRYEFAEALRMLLEEPGLAETMADSGRRYVLENYQWDRVMDRVEGALEEWF